MSASTSSTRKILLNRRALDYLLGTTLVRAECCPQHVKYLSSAKNLSHERHQLQQHQKRQHQLQQQRHDSADEPSLTRPLLLTSVRRCLHSRTGPKPAASSVVSSSAIASQSALSQPTKTLKRGASTQAQQRLVQLQIQQSNAHEQELPVYEDDDGFDEPLPGGLHKRRPSFTSDEMLVVQCRPDELRPKVSTDKLVFGHVFTDHMFRADWDIEQGWSRPVISKVHNLELHPGAKVLHYAVEAFEGCKAYRGHDDKIRFFRLESNIRRLMSSARRLALPEFDGHELIKCIHRLVQLEQDWIPEARGRNQLSSLYIRPTVMAVEPSLGVASSKKALLYVLLSPVGPYFKTGFKPISLYANPNVVRAWPGGAGNAKLGSNYAPTIAVQREAEKLGLQQVLWLFGDDMKLTEVGTMNIFISIRNNQTGKLHLVTPPLTDGLILPGITRDSILELAKQWDDVVIEERYVTISELQQLLHENRIVEMFGSGTACIVCPVDSIRMHDGKLLEIPSSDVHRLGGQSDAERDQNGAPSLTSRILTAITDIQYGRVKHSWATELMYP